LNSLPEVKQFLRSPGGADLYPELEIKWERGHDPELLVRRCAGPRDPRKPRAEGGGPPPEVVATLSLAMYDRTQLHYLMQCHGLEVSRRTEATPVASSREKACEMLPPVSSGMSWFMTIVICSLALVPAGLFCRWARGGVPTSKLLAFGPGRGAKKKEEDVATRAICSSTEGDMHSTRKQADRVAADRNVDPDGI